MTALPRTTKSRLQKIPQVPSVWEGDRRSLAKVAANLEPDIDGNGECIIWVDGSEGCVRAMDIVSPDMGLEAVVRTLLRAIESPHHPAQPARPQKIIVRDREIQFFLRGALQNLDIAIEYVSDLPLIDQLFRGFSAMGNSRPPSLPPNYDESLYATAEELWEDAPWACLADHDILELQIDGWDCNPIYVCVMGMMASEYGVLLYRSLDSLKQFRSVALNEKAVEQLEKAFLAQDCWFLNYELLEDEVEEDLNWQEDEEEEMAPFFGSLHPYEGMRPFLDEEEAKIVFVALQAILHFCRQYQEKLIEDEIEAIRARYDIALPKVGKDNQTISVQVSTLPELSKELLSLGDIRDLDEDFDPKEISIPIEEDLIPDGSIVTLGSIPHNLLEEIKQQKKTYYQGFDSSWQGKDLPVIIIQTSRPKAKTIIETIKDSAGLKSICFNPGNDPYTGESYDLGMLQTGDGKLHIFAEYLHDIPQQTQAVERWYKRCQKTRGLCGLIIAMGVTGTSRGNPQPKDMLAILEAKSIQGEELGMGILQLLPQFDFE
ncbi:MAG: hypothetical protein QNJ34_15925 [Xenococcaceae cyanobacterium MO_188.B29]|nr:hypothetical protein [Xenococcaceae cyanobacterium MO_188.B29]